MRKQAHNTQDLFEIGAKVYFKQNIDKKWCGPGHVIGQDHATVYIRQDGILHKAHSSCTQLVTDFEHQPTFNTINLPANTTICKQVKHYKKQIQIQ